MSPIGRLFVVANLALAALFVGWASSTLANAQKFKLKADTAQAELESTKTELEGQIADLEAQKREVESSLSTARDDLSRTQTERQSLQDDLSALEQAKTAIETSVGGINETLDQYRQANENLAGQLETANNARVEAVEARNEAQNAANEAQQEATAAMALADERAKDIAELNEEIASGADERDLLNTQLEAVLAMTNLTREEIGGDIPTIPAAVLGVMEEGGLTLVQLNKGTDAGVKRGYQFWLYDGARMKGRARVEVVNATTSTAVLVDNVEGRTVSQGDTAKTRL